MRPLAIVGILLMLAGGYVLVKGFTYTKEKHEINVGPIEGTIEEKESVPTWAGVAALVGGAVLLMAGMKKSNA